MIAEDDFLPDARGSTVDRYVIEPSFAWWQRDCYDSSAGATPVAEGFRFASDTNSDWLDTPRLKTLIAEAQ